MNIVFFIIGGLLVVISIVSYVNLKGKEKQLFTINSSESMTIAELNKLAGEVASDESVGKGYFNKDVKISGTIETNIPLKAEFSNIDCVWYSSKVIRVYEVEVEEKDSDGNIKKRIERREEAVSDRHNQVEFWINDGTGKIYVSMNELDFDKDEIYDKFVPYSEVKQNNYRLRIGTFELVLDEQYQAKSHTIGYRYIENALIVGKKVLITGDARDVDGKLRLYKPQENYLKFMLRFGTETEITDKLNSSIKTMNKIMPVTGIIGLVGLLVGLILSIF